MARKIKVGIIGSGAVGSTAAYALILKNLVSELALIDTYEDFAKAQAADLKDGAIALEQDVIVKQTDYSVLKDYDIVVITASVPAKKMTNRLDLYEDNKKLMKKITKDVVDSGFKGIYIVASNPVDLMTKVCSEYVGYPTKVIGSGTILDSARLESEIAKKLNVDVKEVEADVIGEHGDSSVSLFSLAKVNNVPLKDYIDNNKIDFDYEEIQNKMQNAAYYIFNIKGSTTFGIASSIVKIIEVIVLDTKEVLNVTVHIEEALDAKDVYIPFPSVIGKNGIEGIKEIKLPEEERQEFLKSVNVLKSFK